MIPPGVIAGTAMVAPGSDVYETVPDPAWRGYLRALDHALGQYDVAGARRAWEQAHVAAYQSPGWEGLIAAGRAGLRIADVDGDTSSGAPVARRAYFTALYRACRENSFEGILYAAEAFGELGDREVVEECLGLAEYQLDDPRVRRRVAAFARRLTLPHAPPGRALVAEPRPTR